MPQPNAPRGFGPQPPDLEPPAPIVAGQGTPLSAHLWRIVSVVGLLFALPLYGLIMLGFAGWFGWIWFVLLGIPPMVIMAAGALLLCLEPLSAFNEFRLRWASGWQEYHLRAAVYRDLRWAFRLWARHTFRISPPKEEPPIPVYSNGRPVWHGRVVDMDPPAARYSPPVESEPEVSRETQPLLGGPAMTEGMSKVYRLWSSGINPKWRTCEALGIKRAEWEQAITELEKLGYVRNDGPGKGYRWL